MTLTDKLKREIAEKKAELARLEKLESDSIRTEAIKPLSEYTDEEKIEEFDAIYNSALTMLGEAEENGSENDNDDEHYTWEQVMELLARKKEKFWNYYNSL